MTIEDAIKHCNDIITKQGDCDCANEHKQLLEWLTELQSIERKTGAESGNRGR